MTPPAEREALTLIADIEVLQYGDRTLRLLMERTVTTLRALFSVSHEYEAEIARLKVDLERLKHDWKTYP